MSGLAPARLARIDAWLGGAIERAQAPGAIAMVARGDAVHVAVAGVADLASGTAMARDTIVRIQSMTKPITIAAVLMLVEEGRITLDDPVERWLPELADRRVVRTPDSPIDDTVPATRAITLRDLLTFRAGFGVIFARPGTCPIADAMAAAGIAPGPEPISVSPDAFMAALGALPLAHQPGARWMYHTAIEVLSVLAARLSGQPLDVLLAERIFAPLGMADSGFEVPAAKRGRFATGYALDGGSLVVADAADGQYAGPQTFPSEIVSTADDYRAFMRMMLAEGEGPHGRLLSRHSVRLMMTDQITPEQKSVSYFGDGFWDGRGWGMGGQIVTERNDVAANPGRYGWSGGFGTHFVIDPRENLFATVLTQRMMNAPDDDRIGRELNALAYAALDD